MRKLCVGCEVNAVVYRRGFEIVVDCYAEQPSDRRNQPEVVHRVAARCLELPADRGDDMVLAHSSGFSVFDADEQFGVLQGRLMAIQPRDQRANTNYGGTARPDQSPPIWGYTLFPVSGDNTGEPRLLKRPRRPVSMRATFCVAGFVVFLASAFAETKAPASSLAIFFRFESTYSDIALQEMKRELGPLMERSGYRLDWRNRDEAITPESFDDLVVVDFRGTCLMEAAGLPHDLGGPLGWTHVADGTVLPFSAVECDRVRSALHSASDLVLGRALARVLAHELYHVLAQTVTHQKVGITKPSLSRADLVSE